MLEASSSLVLENSAAAVSGGGGTGSSAGFDAAVVVGAPVVSGGGFGSGGEEGDRNFGVNRWPRDETLALLKIRSDMDVAFRDSTPKAPLWDEVSRKLAELGYHRNAKKCKEKFENIYKYHKRTKEGRSRQQNGKHYRYFEQLEVFDSQSSLSSPQSTKFETSTMETTIEMPKEMTKSLTMLKPTSTSVTQPNVTPPCSIQNPNIEVMSTSTSTTSSSEKESEGDFKKKRKLGDYFERLMKQVLERQENLQNKFIEAIEKCERDRIAREEAWKLQEMARLKREEEMLAQERAIAAAKDAAVIAFLQKISEQATSVQLQLPEIPTPKEKFIGKQENNCTMEYSVQANPSRWPKAEVEALIKLRTNLQTQYQDNGPKGPLWEEISAAMKKLGYDRNAKRCKEKWENINKYYKRVKDSNKRRPEDSKTCPYFHLLDSLHQKKSKKVDDLENSVGNLKPEDILMQMMSQQQQQQHSYQQQELVTEDAGSENVDQNQEDDGEDDDDDNEGDYQIVANNPSSGTTME